MSSVSYVVSPNYRAGHDPYAAKNRNPNDPNMLTTGAYGSAFELALDVSTNKDGTTTDTLKYSSYDGKVNGTFDATSEAGSGKTLSDAYRSLLSAMQTNGELNAGIESKLKDAFGKLQEKSNGDSSGAMVMEGQLMVVAGGPLNFHGISAYQNNAVDSIINELVSNYNKTA